MPAQRTMFSLRRLLPLFWGLAAIVLPACAGMTTRAHAQEAGGRAVIAGVGTVDRSPFSATVTWTTSRPTTSEVEYGLSTSYGLWAGSGNRISYHHAVRLTGLEFKSTYHFRVISGNHAGTTLGPDETVTTTPLPNRSLRSGISRGRVLVDGQPFFPIMQWLQCPSLFPSEVALGVNTFLGPGCSSDGPSAEAAATDHLGALSVLPFTPAIVHAPSLLGWRGPDEPDGSGIRPATVRTEFAANRRRDPAHINLLTLSSNFFNQLSPPAWMHGNRSIYSQYTAAADFPGFDVYPIYGWCRPDLIWWEAASSRQFKDSYAHGKPFYSWIEAASTSSQWCTGRGVYPDEVRAEAWMAITNGARGIGYFTHSWTPSYSQFRVSAAVQHEMRRTDSQIKNFTGPLLGPSAPVHGAAMSPGASVNFIARRYNGATYVFAVNLRRAPVVYHFGGAVLAHHRVSVFDERRSLRSGNGGFADRFGPLAVHIYVVKPTAGG